MIIRGADEQGLVDFITTKFDDLKTARKEKEDRWLECVRAYLSDFENVWDAKAKVWKKSKRFIPLSFDAVESQQSQLVSMMFNGDNWLSFEADTPGRLPHDDTAAEDLSLLVRKQLKNINFEREFGILIKQLAITGNCPYTVGWQKDYAVDYPAYDKAMTRWRQENAVRWQQHQQIVAAWRIQAQRAVALGQQVPPPPQHEMPEPPPVSRELAYCGPTFHVDDIFNFVIDPFSPDPKHALRIKRTFVAKSQLVALSQKNEYGYSVYSNVERITTSEVRRHQTDDFEEDRYRAFGMEMPKSSEVELLEAWGTIEIPGGYGGEDTKTYVSHVCTIANRQTVIRFEPTFLWSGDAPVQLATYRDVPGQVYGIGQLEPLLGLQDLTNVRANQNVDVVAFCVNPEYKCYDDGVIDLSAVSAPNKRHLMGDPAGNMIPLEKNMTGLQLGFQDVEYLKREFHTIAKSQSPLAASSRESATRSSLDAGAVNTDVAKIAAHIEDTVLFRVIDLFVQLNAQYLPKGEVVKSLQDGTANIKEISPETLRRHWLVKIRGSQYVADRAENMQNMMMIFQLLTGNPMLLPAVNSLEMAKKLYTMLGFTDADVVFNDAPTADAILQQMLQLGIFKGSAKAGANGRPGESGADAQSAESAGPSSDAQSGRIASGVPMPGQGNQPAGVPTY